MQEDGTYPYPKPSACARKTSAAVPQNLRHGITPPVWGLCRNREHLLDSPGESNHPEFV